MTPKISLKAARVNASLTQTQAAEKIGVTRDTISNWETGKTMPNLKKLKTIESVYGVPFDAFNFVR